MDYRKEFVNLLDSCSRPYGKQVVMDDFLAMAALSIQNSLLPRNSELWRKHEDSYLSIASRYKSSAYGREVVDGMPKLLAIVVEALEEKYHDFLGIVYMDILASDKLGQFFTPDCLSELIARMTLQVPKQDDPCVWINEPACGCGSMVIAAVNFFKNNGVDLNRKVHFVAQDLSYSACYASYIQLSLIGASAHVLRGDTLDLNTPPSLKLFTPVFARYPKEQKPFTKRVRNNQRAIESAKAYMESLNNG